MKRHEFVETDGLYEVKPYLIQWFIWCWRRPSWLGLPLAGLFPIVMVIDILFLLLVLITSWGDKDITDRL